MKIIITQNQFHKIMRPVSKYSFEMRIFDIDNIYVRVKYIFGGKYEITFENNEDLTLFKLKYL